MDAWTEGFWTGIAVAAVSNIAYAFISGFISAWIKDRRS